VREKPHVDVAAFIDTINLLSLLRCTVSYDFLSLALTVDHVVIRARAAAAFVGVRYHKAEHGLLRILDGDKNYSTEPALAALAINGSPECIERIVAACDGQKLAEQDAELVANVLVEISKQSAQVFAVKHSTHGSPMLKSVSFHVLDILKNGGTVI